MVNHDSGNSLLSSRLSGQQSSKKTQQVPEVNSLRRHATDHLDIPAYDAEHLEQKAKKHRGEKQRVKQSGESPLSRVAGNRTANGTQSSQWSERTEGLDNMPDAISFDEDLERESLDESHKREKRKVLQHRFGRVAMILMIFLCVYMAFLIFGVTQTNYIYDEAGQVQPEVLSIDDKKNLAEYESLSQYYLRARILYEQALTLDYQLSENADDSLALATEYSSMLDAVAKLTVDIDAADFSTGYTGIQEQLLNWVKTDIAVYLQNISAAIINNDSTKAENAIISRDVMYSDFSTLTANMATLCKNTKGAKNGDIFAWSPESFVNSLEEG